MTRGRVGIGNCNGVLRLQWTHEGKQKAIYLGLPDTPENRRIAELKAKQIETDLVLGNYDDTLARYKPRKKAADVGPALTKILENFIEHKSKQIDPAGLPNYRATLQSAQKIFTVRVRYKFVGQGEPLPYPADRDFPD